MNIAILLAVGSGGFVGAVLRHIINNYIAHHYPHTLPYGILFVNLLGSFTFGVLFAIFSYTAIFSHDTKLYIFITTGMLGALTTYSTFAMDSFMMLHSGHYAIALLNISLNLFGTILFAGVGFVGMAYFLQ